MAAVKWVLGDVETLLRGGSGQAAVTATGGVSGLCCADYARLP